MLCGAVHVLPALFDEVLIPPAVFRELQHPHPPEPVRGWRQRLPAWITVRAPISVDPTLDVDQGEREAISLAREVHAAALLIDDRKGRSAALRCGLRVAGTIGLLEAGAARGLLELPPTIGRLRETTSRLDAELIEAALARDQARARDRGPVPPP